MRDKDIDYDHKLTEEEREWLKNFNEGVRGRNKESLEKICVNDDSVTRIIEEEITKDNSKRRDIMKAGIRIRASKEMAEELGHDEAFENLIKSGNLDLEAEIPRKRDDGNYTADDYMGNDFPSEDLLIAMIDHDKAVEEAKKIKDFMAAKAKKEQK